jgi:hypothetical protein
MTPFFADADIIGERPVNHVTCGNPVKAHKGIACAAVIALATGLGRV